MAKLYNLSAMTVASTGTGTITLGAAATINSVLYLSFAAAGVADGETVAYSISDTRNSEVGTGVYTAAGTTLTRGAVNSTNGNAAINMTSAAIVRISPAKADVANLRESNTFTGAAQTFSPPAGAGPAITLNQTVSGTLTSTTIPQCVNALLITDNGFSAGQSDGFLVKHFVSSGTGTKMALHGFSQLVAPQLSSDTNETFTGVECTMQFLSGNNGGLGTEKGVGIGALGTVSALSAATNLKSLFGAYCEAEILAGGSALHRIACLAIDRGNNVHGSVSDAAFAVTASATNSGFFTGLLFTSLNSSVSPIHVSGTLIASSGVRTVTGGIDWSSYTFTGNEYNSQNMQLTGAGALQIKQNNQQHTIGTINPSSTSFSGLTIFLPTDSVTGGGGAFGAQVGSSALSFSVGNESALSGSSIYNTGMGFFNSSSRYRFFGLTSGTVITSSQGVLTITPATIDNNAWTAFTPTATVTFGTFGSSQYTSTGRYKQIGKTCFAEMDLLTVANTSTVFASGGQLVMSLPFTSNNARYIGTAMDYGATFRSGAATLSGTLSSSLTSVTAAPADGTTSFLSSLAGVNAKVGISIVYETT